MLSNKLKRAQRRCKSLWLGVVLTLTGCATFCPTPDSESLQLPQRPSVSTPLSQTKYSDSASGNIKTWQQKLTATQLMSKP